MARAFPLPTTPALPQQRARGRTGKPLRRNQLSPTEDAPAVAPVVATPAVADPAPLGLAAFALTTFLLSVVNAHFAGSSSGSAWLGYALAYGGGGPLVGRLRGVNKRKRFWAPALSTFHGRVVAPGPPSPARAPRPDAPPSRPGHPLCGPVV